MQIGKESARPGSLAADALADLVVLQEFAQDRDRALQRLFGQRLGRSHLRDELIRLVVIDFGLGQSRSLRAYQKACAPIGSASATREACRMMSDLGLFVLASVPRDKSRSATLVLPTQRLVDWYSAQMPKMLDQVQLVMERRGLSIVPNDQS